MAGELGCRKKSLDLAPKTVSGKTTVNSQRKGVPDSWNGYSGLPGQELAANWC